MTAKMLIKNLVYFFLIKVIISRDESRLISRSNLTAVSLVTCAAIILAKVSVQDSREEGFISYQRIK